MKLTVKIIRFVGHQAHILPGVDARHYELKSKDDAFSESIKLIQILTIMQLAK